MPYYLETDDRQKLKEILKYQACAQCGERLEAFFDLKKKVPYVQCKVHPEHDGIEREARQFEPNILARREMMEREIGKEKTKALSRYVGSTALTQTEAMEIMETIWPKAPVTDKKAAALLCVSYGLNPLMNHVFLIPFKGKEATTWARVIGIKANRLIASRKGTFSYVDDTPRLMTKAEQEKIFGEVYDDRITAIVKLKDPATGAESVGYGHWLIKDSVYGTEKGNTRFNMAAIRAERQALDRLRPGEMPTGVEVVDEAYVSGDYRDMTAEEELTDIEGEKAEEKAAEEVATEMGIPKEATKEPELEAKPEPKADTPAKEDRRVNNDELLKLGDMIKQTGVTLTQLGKYMKVDKKWEVSKLGDLKKWQFDEIMAAFAKGKAEPPKGKLL